MTTHPATGLYFCAVKDCAHQSEAPGETWWQNGTVDEPAHGDFSPFEAPEPCPRHGDWGIHLDRAEEAANEGERKA